MKSTMVIKALSVVADEILPGIPVNITTVKGPYGLLGKITTKGATTKLGPYTTKILLAGLIAYAKKVNGYEIHINDGWGDAIINGFSYPLAFFKEGNQYEYTVTPSLNLTKNMLTLTFSIEKE